MTFSPILKDFLSIIVSSTIFLGFLCVIIDMLLQVFKDLNVKSTDPFQFKINNFYFTFFVSITYISVFIILLYFLRMYNIGHYFDLKEIFKSFTQIYYILKQINIYLRVYFIILCILLMLCTILTLFVVQYFVFKEIFKLHLYLIKSAHPAITSRAPKYILYGDIMHYVREFMGDDIFIHYLYKLVWRVDFNLDKSLNREKKILDRIMYLITCCRFSKRYKILLALSPLIIIVYDCIFNNWVLVHISQYMLIYIPIMLLKRISNSLSVADYICHFLYEMYYINDNKLYCIPLKFKKLFDSFMLNKLKPLRGIDTFDLEIQLYLTKSFELTDKENNIYTNLEGIELKHVSDGKLYQLEYNYNENDDYVATLTEEWIIIADKRIKVKN